MFIIPLIINIIMDLNRIKELVESILSKEFKNDAQKQKYYIGNNRINFSCPYCGDSSDSRKKRGNLYLNTLTYKCYNGGCGMYKDLYSMLDDFHITSKLESSEKKEIFEIINEGKERRRTIYADVDISLLFDTDFDKVVIKRNDFVNDFGLQNVKGSKIERYLTRRNQPLDDRFAWDPIKEKLYLFNLTNKNEILGLQLRNMSKHGSKYYTYKLSGIWEKLYGKKDEEFLKEARKVDPISNIFGVARISFDRLITIFEGPMDSWFWENSVATCSTENKFPFEIDNIRYWYDWDSAGREKSIEVLGAGFGVFNWKKFLNDHGLILNKKWDLNDLVNYLRAKQIKIKRLDGYFTNDPLDLLDFMNG